MIRTLRRKLARVVRGPFSRIPLETLNLDEDLQANFAGIKLLGTPGKGGALFSLRSESPIDAIVNLANGVEVELKKGHNRLVVRGLAAQTLTKYGDGPPRAPIRPWTSLSYVAAFGSL